MGGGEIVEVEVVVEGLFNPPEKNSLAGNRMLTWSLLSAILKITRWVENIVLHLPLPGAP